MSDDDDSDYEYSDPSSFEDYIAQRACAFVIVAKFADSVTDPDVKEITMTMLRKINSSIKTPSTAELKPFGGGRG